MQVTFTQGIIRGQLDPVNPSYLSKNGSYVDMIVSPDPTLAVVCDADRSYLITEAATVSNAWGPFSGTDDYYLYWNINKATGEMTRGYTIVEPHVGSEPSSPVVDMHWFNPAAGIMSVWNGSAWLQVIRLFAGRLMGGSTVEFYAFGSQVGMNDEVSAGYILHGANNVGVKDSTGRFITSAQELKIKMGALSHPLSIETTVEHAIATEPIPAFSMVSPDTDDHSIRLTSASGGDNAIGMVLKGVAVGESASIHTAGIVYNDAWDWDPSEFGKPLWVSEAGGLTTTRAGNPQCAGLVIWQKHILLDVDSSAVAIMSAVIAAVSAATNTDIGELESAVASLSNSISSQAAAISNTNSAVTDVSNRLSNLVSVVSSETTARVNGDSAVEAAVVALSNVVSNRTSAIVANSAAMTAGDAAAMAAVDVVSLAAALLSNVVSNRTSAIVANSAAMTAGDAAAMAAVSALSAVVSTNKNTLSAAIAANSAAMTAGDASVMAAALNAVSVANNLISNVNSAVLANSAQMTSANSNVLALAMNAVSALSATMANNDANILSSHNALSAVVAGLSAGGAGALNAVSALSAVVSEEVSARVAGDANEASARVVGDTALSNSISALTAVVLNATSARIANDTLLSVAIANEAGARATGDNLLSNAISALSTVVSNEASARAALSVVVSNEISARVAGDNALSNTISVLAAATMEVVSASRTFYVRTDGSDSNDGSANTAGNAFLTIQHAIDYVTKNVSGRGYSNSVYAAMEPAIKVTIQVADGTYPEALVAKPFVGGTLYIVGNTVDPDAVVIQNPGSGFGFAATGAGCNYHLDSLYINNVAALNDSVVTCSDEAQIHLRRMHLRGGAGAYLMYCEGGHIRYVYATGENLTVHGDFSTLAFATQHGNVDLSCDTLELLDTPSVDFMLGASDGGYLTFYYDTLSGTATGKRYQIDRAGVVYAWQLTIPGSLAGTVESSTGGVLIDAPRQTLEVLTASRTYYVRPGGSNSNTGLANTDAEAFQTIQYAVDYVARHVALPGRAAKRQLSASPINLTIQVADGTYIENLILPEVQGGRPILRGNPTTPANCIIRPSAGDAVVEVAGWATAWEINGLYLNGELLANFGSCAYVTGGASLWVAAITAKINNADNIVFSAYDKGTISISDFASPLTINGASISSLFYAYNNSVINAQLDTLVLADTPVFFRTIWAGAMSMVDFTYDTLTGTATGQRYVAEYMSLINTYGGGANYVPGDSAGSAVTGSTYA